MKNHYLFIIINFGLIISKRISLTMSFKEITYIIASVKVGASYLGSRTIYYLTAYSHLTDVDRMTSIFAVVWILKATPNNLNVESFMLTFVG